MPSRASIASAASKHKSSRIEAGDNLHALRKAAGNMGWNRDGWHTYKTRRSAEQQSIAHSL